MLALVQGGMYQLYPPKVALITTNVHARSLKLRRSMQALPLPVVRREMLPSGFGPDRPRADTITQSRV